MWMTACGCVLLLGCSDPIPETTADSSMENAGQSTLLVRIVDTDGAPIPGMIPVMSKGPSMISALVAEGTAADAEGHADVSYPDDQWVYLRAVDPKGLMLADGHVEIEPGEAIDPEERIELKMSRAATVAIQVGADPGVPATTGAELTLLHPAHGAWWRAEAQIASDGRVEFAGLPPGVYALRLRVGDAQEATIREAVLVSGKLQEFSVSLTSATP